MATHLDVNSKTMGQLVRFGIVGLFLTGLYAAVYWPLATYVIAPVLAVVIAFIVAVSVGFFLHSRWSFRGHGQEEAGRTRAKFLIVQTFGMALNAGFTWILTGPMHGPTWWPLVPAVLITPFATFLLNRQWVFG
ncbi:MAG: GtrA family protein [Sphingomicrobium sp.]